MGGLVSEREREREREREMRERGGESREREREREKERGRETFVSFRTGDFLCLPLFPLLCAHQL